MRKIEKGVLVTTGIVFGLSIISLLTVSFIYFSKILSSEDDANIKTANEIIEEEFTSIYVDCSYGDVNIVKDTSNWIELKDIYAAGTNVEVRDGTLSVTVQTEIDFSFFGWRMGYYLNTSNGKKAEISIHISEDTSFEGVKLYTGLGSINIEEIETEDIEISSACGGVRIRGIKTTKPGIIRTGFGGINIGNADFEDMNIFSDVGRVNINLVDDVNTYDVCVVNKAGSAQVGNESEAGIGANLFSYGSKDRMLRVSVGMGKVNIQHTEEIGD